MISIETTSRLPAGYQEVSYIKTSGTQYINTKFTPNDNTTIQLIFSNDDATTGNYNSIIGTRNNASNANCFALWIDPNRRFGAFYGTGQSITLFPSSLNATAKHTLTMAGRVAEIDGTTVTCPATTSSPSYPFFVGACNTGGTADYFSKITVYELKIYDNGTLVRDFVPCYRKNDNAAGLYDLVNDAFYSNAGSGSFTAGSDVDGAVKLVVTEGGVIPQIWALRRRLRIDATPRAATITMTGSFAIGNNENAVIIEGVTYNSAQSIEVPLGTVIQLKVRRMGFSSNALTRIEVNGAVVAQQTGASQTLTYDYTVVSDCVIEGFFVASSFQGDTYGIRLTSS